MMTKTPIKVNFAQGINSKDDPKQLQIGQFTSLQNTVFDVGGQLTKRNGYSSLPSLPNPTVTDYSYITTFNDDLTAIGAVDIAAYSIPTNQWVQKGNITPLSLSVLPVIRNNFNQINCDVAIAPNGLACCVYSENDSGTVLNKYVVFDSVTGQNIVAPTALPSTGTTFPLTIGARVFVLGSHFIIVSTLDSAGTYTLQYLAISTATPTTTVGPTTMSSSYTPNQSLAWDCVVVGTNMYFAYAAASGSINVNFLTSALTLGPGTAFAGQSGQSFTMCADQSNTPPTIFISWFDGSSSVKSASVNPSLVTVFAPFTAATASNVVNLASASVPASGNFYYIFFEVEGTYGYDATIPNNDIHVATISGNTIFSVATSLLGVGLASKAFIFNGFAYYLAAYQSQYQPTYFLVNGSTSTSASPYIVAKLAYSNGGGYLPTVLPNVAINGSSYVIPYLFKDLVQSVNKNTNVPAGSQVNGIYSQVGINMSTIIFGTKGLDTEEIGNNLHLTGGFLGMYDGYLPVEHNFFLWPDSVEAAYTAGSSVSTTGSFASGSSVITVVSAAGIAIGMDVSDALNPSYIPVGATVVSIVGTTITISAKTTHSGSGESLLFVGEVAAKPDGTTNTNAYYYQVTYEWSDNQGNQFKSAPSIPVSVTTTGSGTTGIVTLHVPTLRCTMKVANPVKIVIYRWSVAQEEYYQVTSLISPLLNDTTAEYVTFVDASSDATILGNNLLYTTGGVVEDVNAPASSLLTLFDARLWLVDAEDPNKVWYSKQVIEATPVEMSDLLTLYIPPSVGTSLNTGPITSIATMDDKLLLAKSTSWVYINGTGPDNTGANSQYSQPIYITSTVGCSNQHSIVLSPNGLMFQSSKGIWLIGRDLQCSYIGAPVQKFTTGANVTSAELMPSTTQVRFTLDSGIVLMYDYYYGQWATFNITAVDSCIFQGLHTYIDATPNIWQETPGLYIDGASPVNMSFTTGPIRLGDMDNYQRVYFFYLLGTYISPHQLALSLTYDYGPSPSQTITIEPGAQVGITSGSLEAWRIFPMVQRCRAISLTLQESYDATLGPAAGQGLTLSGLNFLCGFKRGQYPMPASNSAG